MNARMLTRNVIIQEKRTTIRLASAVWEALDELCMRERVSRHELCSRIEAKRSGVNRAQAVRAEVVNYYRLALKPEPTAGDAIERALTTSDGLAA